MTMTDPSWPGSKTVTQLVLPGFAAPVCRFCSKQVGYRFGWPKDAIHTLDHPGCPGGGHLAHFSEGI